MILNSLHIVTMKNIHKDIPLIKGAIMKFKIYFKVVYP